MNKSNWINEITDEKFRVTYNNETIINCDDCAFKCKNYWTCSNMMGYPNVPIGHGCKNGRIKRVNETHRISLFKKLKCLLGFHNESFQASTGQWDIFKCNHCGKYHIWHSGVGCGFRTKKLKGVNKEVREVIEKFNI